MVENCPRTHPEPEEWKEVGTEECRHYSSKGWCEYGKECRFTHIDKMEDPKLQEKNGPCLFHPNCKFTAKTCKFLHVDGYEESNKLGWCFRFLRGKCTRKHCKFQHPETDSEMEEARHIHETNKFERFGMCHRDIGTCTSDGCLYAHPWDEEIRAEWGQESFCLFVKEGKMCIDEKCRYYHPVDPKDVPSGITILRSIV